MKRTLLAAFLAVVSLPVLAIPVTYSFEGTIEGTVRGPPELEELVMPAQLTFPYVVGARVAGSFTIENDLPDTQADPASGVYRNGVLAWDVSIGGFEFLFDPAQPIPPPLPMGVPISSLTVGNGAASGIDTISLRASRFGGLFDEAPASDYHAQWGLHFRGPGTTFDTDAWPSDLGVFGEWTFIFAFFDQQNTQRTHQMVGNSKVVRVPEPSTLALLLLGLAILIPALTPLARARR